MLKRKGLKIEKSATNFFQFSMLAAAAMRSRGLLGDIFHVEFRDGGVLAVAATDGAVVPLKHLEADVSNAKCDFAGFCECKSASNKIDDCAALDLVKIRRREEQRSLAGLATEMLILLLVTLLAMTLSLEAVSSAHFNVEGPCCMMMLCEFFCASACCLVSAACFLTKLCQSVHFLVKDEMSSLF